MIAKLYGKIDTLDDGFLILNVNGVGYLVFCSSRTLGKMPAMGEAVSLFIETSVREDAINLYGFADEMEKRSFNLLTTVQGVGAKAAFAILSAFSPDELELAIGAGDAKVLTKAQGVGAKLATRLVTELKGKMGVGISLASVSFDNGGGVNASNNSILQDAISALVNLGYQKMDAVATINKIAGKADKNSENLSVQDLIKSALKEFAK